MNQDINNKVLKTNLEDYINILIENYHCKNFKHPSILVELSKELYKLDDLSDITKLSPTDHELNSKLENILRILETTSIDEKELNTLKNAFNKDFNSYQNKKMKKFEEKLKYVINLTEKAVKKFPELGRDIFYLHENNFEGLKQAEQQNRKRWSNAGIAKIGYYTLYKDSISRETIPFNKGMEIYLQLLQKKINNIDLKTLNTKEYNFSDSMKEEKKIIEEYENLVNKGVVQTSTNNNLTFFGKLGFKPIRKQISEREIIEKLSQNNYIIDLLDNAIGIIKEIKSEIDLSNTLKELHNLRQKYSSISNKLNDELKNSNYQEMKKEVEQQREIEKAAKINELNRQKVKLLYKKILKSNNDEEIKKLLEEIRFIELTPSEKETEKNNAVMELETELENKRIEQKIIKEEYDKEQEYKKEVANGLRQRAIQALELEGAFSSDYYELGLDVRDSMTSNRREELIHGKIKQLSSQNEITKQEQALQDLKDLGYLKREDATLSNLKPFERDALLAQMRINAKAEEEQNIGHNR